MGVPMTIRLILLAALYYLAGTIALTHFATLHASASPVWPPAGIALAAFLLLGHAAWPAIFAGAFLVNVTASGAIVTSLMIAVGNTAAGLLGAQLAERWANGARAFERASDVFRFLGLAAAPSAALSATVGVLALAAAGAVAWQVIGLVWLTWWLGDLAGELVVTPVVLLWSGPGAVAALRRRPLETSALVLGLAAVGTAVFAGAGPFATRAYPLAFLTIPALVWAAFRFGPVGAAGAMLLTFALAVYGTLRGAGPFAMASANESLLVLQGFMVVMAGTVLPMAALVWDREDVEQERTQLLAHAQAAQREAEERRRIAEEFAGLARSLTETLDIDAIGRRVVEAVLALFGARASGLRLLNADGGLVGVAFGGAMKDAYPPGHVLPGGPASVSGLAVGQRAAAFTDDVFTDARLQVAEDLRAKMLTAGDAAVLAVPLRAKGQIIGALSIADRRGRRFTQAEADMLQVFADQVAVAVENARLFEEAMQQRRESDVIAALAADINRALDVDRVLQRVAEAVVALCSADVSRIALHDAEADTMSFRVGVGIGAVAPAADVRLRPGQGIGGWVMTTGRPYRSADVAEDPKRHPDFQPMIDAGSFRSVMIVPIHGESGVEGLICVGRRTVRPFNEREEMICQRLAAHAAIAVRNSRLFAAERDARAEAHAANRAKDHFLATLSHELRTPLNAMLGWLRMLRNPRLDDVQKTHAVDVIERNARLQTQLINDLLDVSRIVAGKLDLEAFPLDLVPVVQEAIEAVRADVEAKSLVLASELDPRTGEVNGDPMRLQQVVTNLLSNAVKFTPAGGHLDVRLSREGGHARLTVTDSGEGIDPEVLRHIFEPFLQADTSTRRTHQGLGLGLAIVRQLVEAHGGRVHAESDGRGLGARFVVELPIVAVRTPRVGAPPERRGGNGSRLDGLHVLVVDDQSDAREVVGLVLRERGAEVHLAGSVAEALAVLHAQTIDVLVSDLAMPGADGYDLIRAVRAERERPIRAVALTAYTDHEVRERAMAAGYAAHATKPLNPDDLVELIAKLPRS
jgi:signal transduction histidine kinase/integral membrane sensor domain MASE1/CheY-like chemotaxis protein/putative methionine-R-sulfoxide reductase with GAF domain